MREENEYQDLYDGQADYQTLPRDLYKVAVNDVARDIIASAANQSKDFNTALVEEAERYLVDRQVRRLREMGHDRLGGWSYELHHDLTADFDPCPNCGNDGVFNVRIETGEQMVGSPGKSLDDQEGKFHADDGGFSPEMKFARCGECGEVLLDEEDEDEE